MVEFTLDNILLSPKDLMELLRLMPSLTGLFLYEPNIQENPRSAVTDELFKALHGDMSLSFHPLLPLLRELEIEVPGETFTDQVFTDMVKSRCFGGWLGGMGILKSVYLKVWARGFDRGCATQLGRVLGKDTKLKLWDRGGFLDIETMV